MFNVSSAAPGFRLGIANDAPGFRLQHFDSPNETYEMLSPMALLACNPYLRYADGSRNSDNLRVSDSALVSALEARQRHRLLHGERVLIGRRCGRRRR
jgi:hypothetical protein